MKVTIIALLVLLTGCNTMSQCEVAIHAAVGVGGAKHTEQEVKEYCDKNGGNPL